METGKMKLALSAGALALSMALAGCGGSSSSGGPDGPGGELETEEPQGNIKCGAGTEVKNGECVPTSRDRAGQNTAEALHTAIVAASRTRTTLPTSINPTATNAPAITLAKDDTPVAALGSWKGSAQSGDHSSGTSAMLRVYSNRAEPTRPALTPAQLNSDTALFASATIDNGSYALIPEPEASKNIASDSFPAVGAPRKDYDSSERKFRGTFKDAPGEFSCTGTCNAIASADGIDLGGVWTFKPDTTATVEVKDPNYLQFGWWVYRDAAGDAVSVAAFYAPSTGVTSVDVTADTDLANKTATYRGSAAGKFAVYHPTIDIDESGDFTANAMLTATLTGVDSGNSMTGTIDNFKLNGSTQNPVGV